MGEGDLQSCKLISLSPLVFLLFSPRDKPTSVLSGLRLGLAMKALLVGG